MYYMCSVIPAAHVYILTFFAYTCILYTHIHVHTYRTRGPRGHRRPCWWAILGGGIQFQPCWCHQRCTIRPFTEIFIFWRGANGLGRLLPVSCTCMLVFYYVLLSFHFQNFCLCSEMSERRFRMSVCLVYVHLYYDVFLAFHSKDCFCWVASQHACVLGLVRICFCVMMGS